MPLIVFDVTPVLFFTLISFQLDPEHFFIKLFGFNIMPIFPICNRTRGANKVQPYSIGTLRTKKPHFVLTTLSYITITPSKNIMQYYVLTFFSLILSVESGFG